MIQPSYLKPGDKIAIVGLAKKVERAHIDFATKIFKEWGLEVIWGDNLFNDHFRFSATDDMRTHDFQKALDDPAVKAIISGRGGYGSMRVIEGIAWEKFIQHPKWIIGFSDITAVLGSVFNKGIQSIHGIMPAFFHVAGAEVSLEALRKTLFGEKESLEFSAPENIPGFASGILIGGNLSLLCNIMGSSSDFDYNGKILFIEEIDEYLYKIDRMLLQLKRAQKLNNLRGLLVGHFTSINDNEGDPFGKTLPEIILEHFKPFGMPVGFGLPVGHDALNFPMVIGAEYEMRVDNENTNLRRV